MITSSQNSKIKLIRALQHAAKERREAGGVLIEGVRLVEETFAADWPFRFALFADGISERGELLVKKLEDKKVEVEKVDGNLLQSLSETETSQGIIAVLEPTNLPIPKSSTFLLIPDQIRDPGNLGTLLRSAAAAGVDSGPIASRNDGCFCAESCSIRYGRTFSIANSFNDMG